jgi:prophage regulatory protein
MEVQPVNEMIRLSEVMKLIPYSRASIYRLVADGKLPKPVHLGGRSVFWVKAQIQAFIIEQIEKVS